MITNCQERKANRETPESNGQRRGRMSLQEGVLQPRTGPNGRHDVTDLSTCVNLRKFFNFGKKPFQTLVKRPGNKFGFKLSNYISPNDSIEEVEKILRKIAEHVSFTKASPVKPIFHKIFKDIVAKTWPIGSLISDLNIQTLPNIEKTIGPKRQ